MFDPEIASILMEYKVDMQMLEVCLYRLDRCQLTWANLGKNQHLAGYIVFNYSLFLAGSYILTSCSFERLILKSYILYHEYGHSLNIHQFSSPK